MRGGPPWLHLLSPRLGKEVGNREEEEMWREESAELQPWRMRGAETRQGGAEFGMVLQEVLVQPWHLPYKAQKGGAIIWYSLLSGGYHLRL